MERKKRGAVDVWKEGQWESALYIYKSHRISTIYTPLESALKVAKMISKGQRNFYIQSR